MTEQTVVLTNESGLHARPANLFVNTAQKFVADINIHKGETKINGKSILGLLTLAAGEGSEIKIVADGDDEVLAVAELVELIETGFGE